MYFGGCLSKDAQATRTRRSVLILDAPTSGRERLACAFDELGLRVWASDRLDDALRLLGADVPDLVLVDIRISGRFWLKLVQNLRTVWPGAKVVVLTSQPSIASAVRSMQAGVATYLVKPATAQQILAAVDPAVPDVEVHPATLTLDRAIWEYMREVVETAGSISEASRRLGVERRSLRRMLVKYAPR